MFSILKFALGWAVDVSGLEAAIVEFELVVWAGLALAAGLFLLLVDPARVTAWPIVGPLIAAAKRAIAYVLIGLALVLATYFVAYRAGGAQAARICDERIAAIARANQAAIDQARDQEIERTKKLERQVADQVDALAADRASAEQQAAALRQKIEAMGRADPAAAGAALQPIVRRAIRGNLQ